MTTPFGPTPYVYKTAGRMFALVGYLKDVEVVSLKCDPDRGLILRSSFSQITPGYHLNKDHWITIPLDGTVPTPLIKEQIDHAYEIVNAARPRKRPTAKKKPARRRAKR